MAISIGYNDTLEAVSKPLKQPTSIYRRSQGLMRSREIFRMNFEANNGDKVKHLVCAYIQSSHPQLTSWLKLSRNGLKNLINSPFLSSIAQRGSLKWRIGKAKKATHRQKNTFEIGTRYLSFAFALVLLASSFVFAQDSSLVNEAPTEEATFRLLDVCMPLFAIAAIIGIAVTIFGFFIRNHKLSASGVIAASIFVTLYWSKGYGLLGIGIGALLILMRSAAHEEEDSSLQPHRDALGRTIRKPIPSAGDRSIGESSSPNVGVKPADSSSEPRTFKETPFIGKLNRP